MHRFPFRQLIIILAAEAFAGSHAYAQDLAIDSLAEQTKGTTIHTDSPQKRKGNIFHAVGKVFTKLFRNFNDIDTVYIEPQHYNYTVMLQNVNTYEAYTIKSEAGQSFTFAPKTSMKLGPYIGWRWVFLGYTFDIKHLENSKNKREFDLSLYSSMLGIDLYYRKTGDGYRIQSSTISDNIGKHLLKGTPFSGLNVGIKGFDLYYIFNHKKFSYPAAYSQSTRQKKSCGSMLAGIGYTYHSISLDYDALQNTVTDKLQNNANISNEDMKLDEDLDIKSVKYESFSLSAGYAYNWVFLRNCLFSASLSAALAYKNSKGDIAKHGTGLSDFNFSNFNFDGIGRFGIVWNNDKWYAGASTILHSYNYKKSRFSTSSYFGSLNIYFGMNFGAKRAYRKKKG